MTNETVRRLAFIALLIAPLAQAEIYESKDAEGNVVFSDTPTSGAEVVDLTDTNTADAVQPSSDEKSPAMGTGTSDGSAAASGKVVVIPDSHNEKVERAAQADKPHEVLEAEQRYEVGDVPTEEELQRRKEAREGEYTDAEGNVIHYEHRGHAAP